MANTIWNDISISSGNKNSIKAIRRRLFKDGKFTFSALVPPEYNNPKYRVKPSDNTMAAVMNPGNAPIEDNQDKDDMFDWYNFCNDKWGCKWDAREVDIVSDDDDYIEIRFITPWDMPRAWYKKLRASIMHLPDVTVEYTMSDGFDEEYDKFAT